MLTSRLRSLAPPGCSGRPFFPRRSVSIPLLSGALLLVAGFLFPAPRAMAADPFHGEWQQLPPPPPPPPPTPKFPGRTSFVMVLDTSRDRLVAFGGDPGPTNDVWIFPLPSGPAWSRLEPAGTPPSPRYGASAIYDPVGDRLIVYGGYASGFPGDVWQLSFAGTPTWTQLNPPGQAPSARQDPSVVYDPVGRRMIIFGGYSLPSGFSNDVWALSLSGQAKWSRVQTAGAPPSARAVTQWAYDSSRQRIVIFGGWDGTNYLADTWALDLSGHGRADWSPIATAAAPPARREGHAVYDPIGDRMVIFGGASGGISGPFLYWNDTWQITLGGVPNWSPLAPAGVTPSARGNGRAVLDATRQRMLLVGGYDLSYRGDVEALALSGPLAWTRLYDDQAPVTGGGNIEAHRDYAAAYDPDQHQELIFGGMESQGDIDETWRLPLDTATPQWEFIPVGLRPTARHGHRGVWDPPRHRMLVFGGYDTDYRNDLWSFTPVPSPSWQPVQTTGIRPAPRMLVGFGYDPLGDRLLVVGGHGGFSSPNPPFMNDVWQLPLSGPQALQWSPLAVAGTPPAPRWIYGMRYDPPRNRFIVFGGVTAAERPNDAWALNLAGSPTWSHLLPSGIPPTGRSDHTMVYDPLNDRMVVFGGYDNSAFRNDAWSLKLAGSGTWAQLSPSGGPPPGRDIIDAIYDPVHGSMVVYGGWDGASFLNDTWTLTWGPPPAARQTALMVPATESRAEPDLVRLTWHVRRAAEVQASVERSGGSEEWRALGTPVVTALDRVTFEDPSVSPGSRYAYRLRVTSGGKESVSAATEIVVPSGFALELAGARPNPAAGEMWVDFALPRGETARLELLDIAGRRVAAREVGDLGAGRHRVRLGEGLRLAPGVYVIRLVTVGRAITRKALVVR